MDEPHDLPGGAKGWEAASALAVAAIRKTDTRTPIYVGDTPTPGRRAALHNAGCSRGLNPPVSRRDLAM